MKHILTTTILAALCAVTAWADGESNNFTVSDNTYTIHNADGWAEFCTQLGSSEAGFFNGKTVQLDADITVSQMAGSDGHEFTGTFDGGNHTLTFQMLNSTDNYIAPFRYVAGSSDTNPAVIRNLNVSAVITATDFRHAAGLIAMAKGNVNVDNCNVNANISANTGTNNPNDLYPAGLVSQVATGSLLTVSGCTVDGAIQTDGKFAGGMVGIVQGGASISNSLSSVIIQSFIDGDGTHGGLVGINEGQLSIEGCAFNGNIFSVGTHATTNCGGFVGYNKGGASATITKCCFAPNANEGNPVSIGCSTFVRNASYNDSYLTIDNCYYTATLGSAQGKHAHKIIKGDNITSLDISGTSTNYPTSRITVYSHGMKYDGVLYAASGENVSLTANIPLGYNGTYTITPDNISFTANTLNMPNTDVTVDAILKAIDWANGSSGVDADNAYIIYNKDQLNLLAQRVNDGTSQYENKYFKLGNDISYSHKADNEEGAATDDNYVAIGNSTRSFCGNFDGAGHTISGIRIYKDGTDNAYWYQGIFGHTGTGANIHDLTLADARITGNNYTGGIVGYNDGGTISRCHVNADVTVCAVQSQANSHGGIAGYNNSGTIEQCTSAVTLTTASNSFYYGGIVGINYATVTNNLAIGATVPATAGSYGAIAGKNDGTITFNYYVACTVAGTPNATGVGCLSADVNNDGNPYGAMPYIVTFAPKGYATFFDSRVDLVLPAGMKAYVVTTEPDNDNTLGYEKIADGNNANGNVVPANTAVLLQGSATEVQPVLRLPSADAYAGTNLLHGSDVATTTTGNSGLHYKLTYGTGADANDFGWYWGSDHGGSFTSGAHKAWLYIPQASSEGPGAARTFLALPGDGDTDGIEAATSAANASAVWYTLDGRRLSAQPTKAGIYVHGGKKVAIK